MKHNLEIDIDKLNTIKRKFSFQLDRDLSLQEVLDLLIDRASNTSAKSIDRKKSVRADTSVVAEGFEKGMSGQKIANTIGCSLSTVWRHKAKLREESAEL